MTTVFFSYNEADAQVAEKLAAELRARGLKTILETDKQKAGEIYAVSLYEQLAHSHAVVSIISPTSRGRPWIFFEALTARVQDKFFPVSVNGAAAPEGLNDVTPLRNFDDPAAINDFAKRIKARAGISRIYRGRSHSADRGARLGWLAYISASLAGLSFLLALISNAGGARDALCSTELLAQTCIDWRLNTVE